MNKTILIKMFLLILLFSIGFTIGDRFVQNKENSDRQIMLQIMALETIDYNLSEQKLSRYALAITSCSKDDLNCQNKAVADIQKLADQETNNLKSMRNLYLKLGVDPKLLPNIN